MLNPYYPETWYNIANIDDLCDCINETLNWWKTTHFDPDTWANEWLMDNPLYVFNINNNKVIKNDYFSFDLREAVLKQLAEDQAWAFNRCSLCDSIVDIDWDHEEECYTLEELREDDPDSYPDDYELEYEDPTIEEIIEFYESTYGDDYPTDQVTDNMIENAMKTDGFEAYQHGLFSLIDPVRSEIDDALEAIESAQTNQEKLTAVLWASHVGHVNGNICVDYGNKTGLDSIDVESLQQDGLTAIFDQEEIDEWLSEDELIPA